MKPSLLIVAPSQEFAAALQPLVNHKNLTGMPASVVELAAFIAPQHGRDDAECLKMAIFNHAPAPRYVMLVGDASLMPVRYRRTTQQPVVNSSPYDAWFTAADLYYANLYLTHAAGQGMPTTDYDSGYNTWDLNRDGSYDAHHWLNDPQDVYSWNPDGVDGCPDIAVARLPAHTVADVSAYVSKVIAYETGNLPPSDAVFLADGNYPGANSLADGIVSQGGLTANGLGIQRVGFNYGSSGPPPGYQTGEADDIPGTYTKGLFLIYVGHGDTVGWDIAGVSSAAVADYRNTDFPVVISIGCSTGEWILGVPDHTLPGSSAPPLYHGVDGLLHSFTTDHAIGTFPIQVTDAPTTEAGQAEPPTTWTLPAQSAPKIPIPLPNAYDFNRTSPTFAVSWLFNPQGGDIAFCGETTVGPDNLGAEFATAMFGGWYSTGAVLGDMWLRAWQVLLEPARNKPGQHRGAEVLPDVHDLLRGSVAAHQPGLASRLGPMPGESSRPGLAAVRIHHIAAARTRNPIAAGISYQSMIGALRGSGGGGRLAGCARGRGGAGGAACRPGCRGCLRRGCARAGRGGAWPAGRGCRCLICPRPARRLTCRRGRGRRW